ncbi:MFS transporter [Nonomuraea basaltis]|uniref:MFS transporter n=1 Tax=Nonomuraea basaltis TaxID=2495887 RepID=UPI00110C5F48|nr:MFS transporter [Nonomuraea basaltis]TMR96607.1 MFS transporter [Nonomuraea basaltis]
MTDRRVARRRQVLGLLATAFFMTILDGTILFAALPSIKEDLGLAEAESQWTVTAYALAFSGLLLFCGRAADLLGRRRVFLVGVVLRVASSLLCGLAWSGEVLIAARTLQGVSAAVIAPAALSMVMTSFPEGPERNRALGIWGGLGGVGATTGLLLGGVITDELGWPWVFLLNVPVGIGVLILAPLLLRESRDPGRVRAFDTAGAVTVTAALVLLVYAIVTAPEAGWVSGRTAGLLLSAAALAALFVLVESRSAVPLVPLRILRSPSLVGGNLVILSAGMAVDGVLITLTSYVQHVLGWTAIQFGLLAAVMTVASVAGALVSQRLATGIGLRHVATAGTVLLGAACMLLIWAVYDGGSLGVMLIALLIFGAGMGAAFVCSQIAALTGVAEREAGLAAGFVDTSFAIGTALGLAVCSSVALTHAQAADGPALPALTEGYQAAFGVAVVFAVLGLAAALTLLGRAAGSARPGQRGTPTLTRE